MASSIGITFLTNKFVTNYVKFAENLTALVTDN